MSTIPLLMLLAVAIFSSLFACQTSTLAQTAVPDKPVAEKIIDPSAPLLIYDLPKKPLVPAQKIISEKAEQGLTRDKCLMARPAFGDIGNDWSVGFAASVQAVKYTFGTHQASSAASTGAGIAFRYYGKSPIGTREAAMDLGFTDADLAAIKILDKKKEDKEDKNKSGPYYDSETGMYSLPVNKISTTCRATTSDIGTDRTAKLASSLFSLTPTVFYVKQATESELSLQPAFLVGFFDDIISIGPGFNLTGAEKGKVFLVLSLGYGFKF